MATIGTGSRSYCFRMTTHPLCLRLQPQRAYRGCQKRPHSWVVDADEIGDNTQSPPADILLKWPTGPNTKLALEKTTAKKSLMKPYLRWMKLGLHTHLHPHPPESSGWTNSHLPSRYTVPAGRIPASPTLWHASRRTPTPSPGFSQHPSFAWVVVGGWLAHVLHLLP